MKAPVAWTRERASDLFVESPGHIIVRPHWFAIPCTHDEAACFNLLGAHCPSLSGPLKMAALVARVTGSNSACSIYVMPRSFWRWI